MTTTSPIENRDIDADVTIKIDRLSDAQVAALDIPLEPELHAPEALTSDLRAALRLLTAPAPRADARAQWLAISVPSAVPRCEARLPTWPSRGDESQSHSVLVTATVARARAILEHLVAAGRRGALSLRRTISPLLAEWFSQARRENVFALCGDLRRRWSAFQGRLSTATSNAWAPWSNARRACRLPRAYGPGERA